MVDPINKESPSHFSGFFFQEFAVQAADTVKSKSVFLTLKRSSFYLFVRAAVSPCCYRDLLFSHGSRAGAYCKAEGSFYR